MLSSRSFLFILPFPLANDSLDTPNTLLPYSWKGDKGNHHHFLRCGHHRKRDLSYLFKQVRDSVTVNLPEGGMVCHVTALFFCEEWKRGKRIEKPAATRVRKHPGY